MRRLLGASRRRRDESGAVALVFAVLATLLLVMAALSVDIGVQVNKKQQLQATLDAAAQSGASKLPGSTTDATATALAFARTHDPTSTGANAPNVDYWCVVSAVGSAPSYAVDTTQVPSTCYPGVGPYTVGSTYGGTNRKITCGAVVCAIPCVVPTPNTRVPAVTCNTIRVFQGRTVPFAFGPAGGLSQGSTGSLVSVACRGSCGTVPPNPLDVAVVADRTGSMSADDVDDMVSGISGMLQAMTPSQQYVALGTIGRSVATSTAQPTGCSTSSGAYPSSSITTGTWLPVSFSSDYLTNGAVNTGSSFAKQLACLDRYQSSAAVGTQLAAPMKSAARYLLGLTSNNLSSLPARNSPAQKVLIFETDGQPDERISTAVLSGSTDLNTSTDPYASQMYLNPTAVTTVGPDTQTTASGVTTVTHNTTVTYTYAGGETACSNLLDVAARAKAAGIRVITIAYNIEGLRCNDWDGRFGSNYEDRTNYTASDSTVAGPEASTRTRKYQTRTITKNVKASSSGSRLVLSVLAAAAGTGSTTSYAETSCGTTTEIASENADGDDFFCAATGTEMAPVFKTALSQASSGIKLMNLP